MKFGKLTNLGGIIPLCGMWDSYGARNKISLHELWTKEHGTIYSLLSLNLGKLIRHSWELALETQMSFLLCMVCMCACLHTCILGYCTFHMHSKM